MVLSGIKVVEISTWFAGPTCGMWLGEWGADVIRVEPIEGDAVRGTQAKDRCGQTIQQGEECHSSHLKMLMLEEQRFRRLDTPEKLRLVYLGIDLKESLEAKRDGILAVA